ncbi:membrane-spanning 4-domains subfamily A member 15-like [Acanthochromis polyacanthus]|uniref:membrane-spanning 4-domains subfamily A member 15-like n=1 Tax=Acanthochromis polyacanthus TaxID=80966 RepID=UPI002234ACAB|nr:membrane-spanning 4-domains subfamily A member 15-like [Acanthochromis polyacanthus]
MFSSVVLLQTCLTAALGAVQIMVGLFNIGLGPGRTSIRPGDLTSVGAAYWLGAVFIVTGIMSILSGRFPSSCLMGFTVFMNIVGAIFAITGIVLYVIDLREASFLWMCERNTANRHDDSCRKVALIAESLLASMDITLIGLIVLQLFVSVWFAVMGIKSLIGQMRKSSKDIEEQFKEVTCVD